MISLLQFLLRQILVKEASVTPLAPEPPVYGPPSPLAGGAFKISARDGARRDSIGQIVVYPDGSSGVCYVTEICVSTFHRRRGIATKLMYMALEHAGCSVIVPVSVEEDAREFWALLPSKAAFAVRDGIGRDEMLRLLSTRQQTAAA